MPTSIFRQFRITRRENVTATATVETSPDVTVARYDSGHTSIVRPASPTT